MVSVGELIFVSVRPLVKLILPTLAGFCLARLGQFPEQSTKSVVSGRGLQPSAEREQAYLTLNVTLPALLFSKISLAINAENVSFIGVIVLSALTCTSAS